MEKLITWGADSIPPDVAKKIIGEPKIVGRVFGTPLEGRRWISLPVAQGITWLIMAKAAAKRRPDLTRSGQLKTGALTMSVMLGSEWCHNLAHAFAANAVGKPMDKIKIYLGMPRLHYSDINDPTVAPRQHIIRALGGPMINLLLLPLTVIGRSLTKPGTTAREVADVAVGTNTFLSTISFLPLPYIDGGPILKWSLVERGATREQAEQTVQEANGIMAFIFSILTGVAFWQKKPLLGFLAGLFATSMFGIFKGWIREEEIPF